MRGNESTISVVPLSALKTPTTGDVSDERRDQLVQLFQDFLKAKREHDASAPSLSRAILKPPGNTSPDTAPTPATAPIDVDEPTEPLTAKKVRIACLLSVDPLAHPPTGHRRQGLLVPDRLPAQGPGVQVGRRDSDQPPTADATVQAESSAAGDACAGGQICWQVVGPQADDHQEQGECSNGDRLGHQRRQRLSQHQAKCWCDGWQGQSNQRGQIVSDCSL